MIYDGIERRRQAPCAEMAFLVSNDVIARYLPSLNQRSAQAGCNIRDQGMALTGFVSSSRENLASRTYSQLREALMAGRFWPGQRLRIRELSSAMGVSDTPVREATCSWFARAASKCVRASPSP